MRMIGLVLLGLLSAYSGPVANGANIANASGAASGTVVTSAVEPARNANATIADCPETELSCGRQRPVISDGVTRFVNENYYLSVVFPQGSPVCMTRSGDAPHGFDANYGDELGCAELPNRAPRFIALYAEFNALFYHDVAEALPDGCGTVSPEIAARLGAARIAFPGYASTLCQMQTAPGRTLLYLYTLAGPWQEGEQNGSRVRKATYFIAFSTTDDHFDEDLARFRRVLASVRIASRD